MRRLLVSVLALTLAMTAGPALADDHDHDHGDLPRHPHVLLLHFEQTEEGVRFERCIDLAANNPLPLNAHHQSVHQGTAGAGELDVGLTAAGHVVIPMSPFPQSPFEDCADVEEFVS